MRPVNLFSSMIKIFQVLDVRGSDVVVEYSLNGVPFARVGGHLTSRVTGSVNHLLVAGGNVLAAKLGGGARPDSVDSSLQLVKIERSLDLSAVLQDLPEGSYSGEVVGPTTFHWSRGFEAGTELGLPLRFESEFEMPGSLPRWEWQRAPKLQLDAGFRAAVVALLARVVDSLRRGAPGLFLKLADIRFREVARAFGLDADVSKSQWAESLRRFSERPDWILPDPENVALRLVADDRMVECLASDWRPVVRGCQDANGVYRVTYPMLLALVDGELAIVR